MDSNKRVPDISSSWKFVKELEKPLHHRRPVYWTEREAAGGEVSLAGGLRLVNKFPDPEGFKCAFFTDNTEGSYQMLFRALSPDHDVRRVPYRGWRYRRCAQGVGGSGGRDSEQWSTDTRAWGR